MKEVDSPDNGWAHPLLLLLRYLDKIKVGMVQTESYNGYNNSIVCG